MPFEFAQLPKGWVIEFIKCVVPRIATWWMYAGSSSYRLAFSSRVSWFRHRLDLICQKLLSIVNRPHTPKGMMDGADLRRLLLTFPELKVADGIVADTLRATQAPEGVETWCDWVAQEIQPEDDEARILTAVNGKGKS